MISKQAFLYLILVLLGSQFLFSTSCGQQKGSVSLLIQDTTIYSRTNFTNLTLDQVKFAEQLDSAFLDSNICKEIISFYDRRNNQLAWFTENGISEAAFNFRSLVDLFKRKMVVS